MDWRKLMGAKPKDEHFDSYPQSPQKSGEQGVFTNIADNTDITDRDGKAKNVDKGVDWGFEGPDKPKTKKEPSEPIADDDFPHAEYEASLDWMDPACCGGYPDDQMEDGKPSDDIEPPRVAPADDRNSRNSVVCPVGHTGRYEMWRWKKGGQWVCSICHPFQGGKGKIDFLHVGRENEHFDSYPQYPHNPQYSELGDNITDITDITDKGEKVKIISEVGFNFEERAAIMEFDGGLSKEDAEEQARERVRQSL